MRKMKIYFSLLAGILALIAGACTPTGKLTPDDAGEHRCTLQLVGGVIPFDGVGTKATGTYAPSKDNRLYVRMIGNVGAVLGKATYDEDEGIWTFTYSGSLAGATSGKAHAVLFEKNLSDNSQGLNLRFNTPIYEDAGASFLVSEGGITLQATLSPKTGRLSFVHDLEEGQSRNIQRVGGMSYYDYFDLSGFSFRSKDLSTVAGITLSRGESGNGEYIYGFFTDKEDPRIMLFYYVNTNGERYYYKYLSPDALEPGTSGYLNVPEVNATGWKQYLSNRSFWINDKEGGNGTNYGLFFVPEGSFQMGDERDITAKPAHQVTLKPYYMGRTEVTRGMWYNLMGEPSDWKGSSLPADGRTYEEIQKFIAAFQAYNDDTSRYRFRLPTEAEWEFAARGGIFSRGYLYSGGNTLSDVAIRQADYAVGTKMGNELTLFDMSGDIAELCSDWYGPYSSESQVNPTGPASGSYRVVRGGYSYDPDEYFTVWHRASADEYGGLPSSAVGFRLVMEAPVIEVE